MLIKSSLIVSVSYLVLYIAQPATAQNDSAEKRLAFQKKLAQSITPIPGNQNGILQTAEARYIATFQQGNYRNASFDTYFYSNDVGGILLRDEPLESGKSLKLDRLTFQLDESQKPAVVLIKLDAAGEQAELSVEASLVAAAARMTADDQLVLLTMAVGSGSDSSRSAGEMLAIHPAIARHRLAIAAARVDDSLGRDIDLDGTYWVLSENPWHLSPKAFTNSEDLFTLECRRRGDKIEIPNLTAKWKRGLSPKQQAAVKQLSDFLVVYRLINAAAEGYLEGFPEQEFLSLLTKIQPHYEAQAVTLDEERDFQTWLRYR